MQRIPNKTMIGLFTILGLTIFCFFIIIFLGNKINSNNKNEIVMYFDESIKGLTVGSLVSFRGVEIGKVSKIGLIANQKDLDFSIPVYVVLDKNQTFRREDTTKIRNKKRFLNELVKKGLRARLMTQSYLTGQLYIELEFLPNTPVLFKNKNINDDIIEIPTALSPLGELSKGIQDLPIRQTFNKAVNVLDSLNNSLPLLIKEISNVVNSINNVVNSNDNGVSTTILNLNNTLNDIGNASKSIKNFMDYLERHPEALIKGKGRY